MNTVLIKVLFKTKPVTIILIMRAQKYSGSRVPARLKDSDRVGGEGGAGYMSSSGSTHHKGHVLPINGSQ